MTEPLIPDGYYTQIPDRFDLGLEEEILTVSGLQVAEMDRSLEEQINLPVDIDYNDTFVSVFQTELFEEMDEKTIRVFETLIENLTPPGVERG